LEKFPGDKTVRYDEDNLSIRILICKTKDRILVEYAMELATHPIGAAPYTYSKYIYRR
jgi:hypothetical protein